VNLAASEAAAALARCSAVVACAGGRGGLRLVKARSAPAPSAFPKS
jgi:hypothetical protein